jgi:type I restriction enzyme S subunit
MKWPTAPLGNLCNVISGGTPKRSVDEYWNGDIAWVKISDMLQGEITSTDECITELGLSESPARLLEPGTLLLSIFATVGRTAILTIPAATNQAIVGLQLKTDALNQSYLRHFLDSQAAALKQKSRGVAQDNINTSILKQLQIPLPPLEEQRRIAAILDKASDLSNKIAKASQFEDELNASLFNEIIGDPVLNQLDLPRVPLIDLCSTSDDIKCGPFGTQLKQHEFREFGVPLWGIKHVNRRFQLSTNEFLDRETADRLSAYSLLEGDIVMTRKGTVGNCCVYPNGLPAGVMHSDLLRIRVDSSKCLPGFVSYQLHHSHDVKRQIDLISGGAIMAGINVGKLKSISILVPDIDMQRRFESLVTAASRDMWHAKASMLHYSRDLMNSLSDRLMGSKDDSLIPE